MKTILVPMENHDMRSALETALLLGQRNNSYIEGFALRWQVIELVAGIDPSALVEALVVVLCGVGLYAGYVQSYQEMLAVTVVLRQLLEGALVAADRERAHFRRRQWSHAGARTVQCRRHALWRRPARRATSTEIVQRNRTRAHR